MKTLTKVNQHLDIKKKWQLGGQIVSCTCIKAEKDISYFYTPGSYYGLRAYGIFSILVCF